MAKLPAKSLPVKIDARQVAKYAETGTYFIRGQKVMLSFDLSKLYEVETKTLMQAVKRNAQRFPSDFMFQLTNQEFRDLRSQIVTLETGIRTYAPYAFTEQGVAMLSSVLRSERAIAVNVEIMRSFVRMRAMLDSNKALAKKVEALESKYDKQFKAVFQAIHELMEKENDEEKKSKRKMGFV